MHPPVPGQSSRQHDCDERFLVETSGKITLSDINETLKERGRQYGNFAEQAKINQAIKKAMADSPNYRLLCNDKREALDMIASKIGRILNGDPEHKDSWDDIAGYALLVADTLKPEQLRESKKMYSHPNGPGDE